MAPPFSIRSALEIEEILDRRGHAVERPERAAFHDLILGSPRLAPCIIEAEMDEGVEAWIALLDAGDRRLDRLDRREIAPANAQRQFAGTHISDVGISHCNHLAR